MKNALLQNQPEQVDSSRIDFWDYLYLKIIYQPQL